jgi:uncharacterized protein (DUF433 family)
MTIKEAAARSVQQLPEDATWEDIQERINFVAGVRKGLRELDEDQGISHGQAREELRGLAASHAGSSTESITEEALLHCCDRQGLACTPGTRVRGSPVHIVSGLHEIDSLVSASDILARITHDPAVMGGRPCIRGMRLTVGVIVGLLGAGHSADDILREYPYLEKDDIQAALAYAAWRSEEIELPLKAS